MTTIYVAGPMTGYKLNNFPRFNEKAKQLRDLGWTVLNPAELDIEAGFDPSEEFTPLDYMRAARRDLHAISGSDAIYLLDGWEDSIGARWEWAYAKNMSLNIYYETPLPPEST
tara:strand:+ start:491 stop:829 length:339 start_codon:yes stop_codon:yes gene_type:complete